MPADAFIFFASDTNWRICAVVGGAPKYVDVSLAPDATAQQRAEKVSTALQSFGYTGDAAILAVPSSWCYAASISTDDLPRNDRKAMIYRLEEKLPLAAESLI